MFCCSLLCVAGGGVFSLNISLLLTHALEMTDLLPCKVISGVVTQALAEETTVCSCARRRISRCCSLRHPLPLTPSSGVAAGVKERAWEQQASDPSISKQSFIIMQRLDLAAEDLEIREAQCELNQIIITRVSKILTL